MQGLTRYVGSQARYRLAGHRAAGAVGGFRYDAAAADDFRQLDSVVVAAHRIHRIGALALQDVLLGCAPRNPSRWCVSPLRRW